MLDSMVYFLSYSSVSGIVLDFLVDAHSLCGSVLTNMVELIIMMMSLKIMAS
jgi:hypothetical protein